MPGLFAWRSLSHAARRQRGAAEFQKFINHWGVVWNFPWGALARLGVARAYALNAASDPVAHDKARAAYQDFLKLWRRCRFRYSYLSTG